MKLKVGRLICQLSLKVKLLAKNVHTSIERLIKDHKLESYSSVIVSILFFVLQQIYVSGRAAQGINESANLLFLQRPSVIFGFAETIRDLLVPA